MHVLGISIISFPFSRTFHFAIIFTIHLSFLIGLEKEEKADKKPGMDQNTCESK
jgi:hypothetical protein